MKARESFTKIEKEIKAVNLWKKVKIRLRFSKGEYRIYYDRYVNGDREAVFTDYRIKNQATTYTDDKQILLKAIAERERLELIAEDEAKTPQTPDEAKVRFALYLREYADNGELPKKTSNSDGLANRKNYQKTAKHWESFCALYQFERLTIAELTRKHFELFAKYLQTKVGANTAHTYFAKVKTVLNRLTMEKNVLPKNPAAGVVISKTKTAPTFLNKNEIDALIQNPIRDNEVMNAFLFQINTGLRFSDMHALTFDKIEADFIRVRVQKTAEPLLIPLNSKAKQIINEQREKHGDGIVFHITSYVNKYNEKLKEWAERAGITKNLSSHVARHTAATLLVNAGASIYTIAAVLGHSDIKNTQRYSHLLDSKKSEAVNLIDY